MLRWLHLIPFCVFLLPFPPAAAEDIRFSLPIDCAMGRDCHILKYVDMVQGGSYRDYRCGPLANDRHKGTDFQLRDIRQMEIGVDVLAAAPGVVIQLRDGMPDVMSTIFSKELLLPRGLGNVVALRHDNGWISRYGHLKRGSLKVKRGDRVEPGQVIGQVGLSGISEFPHLHFDLISKPGVFVDPFTGREMESGCDPQGSIGSLWTAEAREQLTYRQSHLVSAGFAPVKMSRSAMIYGLFFEDFYPANAEKLHFNALVAGVRKGDVIQLRIFLPGSTTPIFDQSLTVQADRVLQPISGGRFKSEEQRWGKGKYRGEVTLKRDGQELLNAVRTTVVR